jgi:hypothetical protein
MSHPEGLRLSFRSYRRVQEAHKAAGFSDLEINPFVLPIDLPRPRRLGA